MRSLDGLWQHIMSLFVHQQLRICLLTDVLSSGPLVLWTRNCLLLLQDRITDHRANVSRHGWEAMMRGELLDAFLDALREKSRTEQLNAAGLQ